MMGCVNLSILARPFARCYRPGVASSLPIMAVRHLQLPVALYLFRTPCLYQFALLFARPLSAGVERGGGGVAFTPPTYLAPLMARSF